MIDAEGLNYIEAQVSRLEIKPGELLVVSVPPEWPVEAVTQYQQVMDKIYGHKYDIMIINTDMRLCAVAKR